MVSICTFGCSGRSGLTMWRTKRSDFELGLYSLGLYFLAYTSQSDWELLLLLGIQHLNIPTNSRTNTTIPASIVHTQEHFYTATSLTMRPCMNDVLDDVLQMIWLGQCASD